MGKALPKSQLLSKVTLEAWLIIAIAFGVLWRIVNVSQRQFWYDEVLSLLLSTGQKIAYKPPPNVPIILADYTKLLNLPAVAGVGDFLKTIADLLRGIVGVEPHPPLFYLSQHIWLYLLGNSEGATRSLGMLLSIAAIASAYGLGRSLLGHRGGLIFAALLAVNPFYLFHSLNLRMYAPLPLWAILSTWALLEISRQPRNRLSGFGWHLILIGSLVAGLMTFYLFLYWFVTLSVLALFLDRQRWWKYYLNLAIAGLITLPWFWWGTRQQLRNADLDRFDVLPGFFATLLKHSQGIVDTLGIQLLLGDWVTSLPPGSATLAGCLILGLLLAVVGHLWRSKQDRNRRSFVVALILGLLTLLLALSIDILTGKFTLGFGLGRSIIFILPGNLLLLTVWLEQNSEKWKLRILAVILIAYIGISGADFAFRDRTMFADLNERLIADSNQSTLMILNSRAWGHVLRLAYYIPPQLPVMLLAQPASDLSPALTQVLADSSTIYQRIFWLDSANPIWSSTTSISENNSCSHFYNPIINCNTANFCQGR